jgi:hypothetical protein
MRLTSLEWVSWRHLAISRSVRRHLTSPTIAMPETRNVLRPQATEPTSLASDAVSVQDPPSSNRCVVRPIAKSTLQSSSQMFVTTLTLA